MKRKFLAIGATLVVLLLLAVYLSQNSSTPPGQEALTTLSPASFPSFEQAFDKSSEGPRLLLLLSPT